jgi:hypothetical protein
VKKKKAQRKKKKAQRKKEKAQRKLWRPLKAWVPRQWATMHEAWSRIYASLSEDMAGTRRDIKADLLAGDLVGAARIVRPDGTERCIIFERDFWKPVEFPYAWNVTGWNEHYREGEKWRFFVRRRELDRRYRAAATTMPSERPADSLFQEITIPRLSSGRSTDVAGPRVSLAPPRRGDPPEYDMIRQKACELYPQGWKYEKTNVLVDRVSKALGKDAPRHRYKIERALGRRRKR